MGTSPYATSARATVVTGHAGSGKTERLASEAARLLGAGTSASHIVVFAASRLACAAFRRRLHVQAGEAADAVRVLTLREFALSTLSDPRTEAATGRSGRVLLKFEEAMLMEDMKTSGVHPKRLRNMIQFFYRSWADIEPMDSAWFYSDEEENVHVLLKNTLAYLDGFVPQEISRAAYDHIQADRSAREALSIPYVFVDDYQTLSKASQCLASALCNAALYVAGDEDAAVHAIEEYPAHDGLSALIEANPSCTVIDLKNSYAAPDVTAAVEALRTDVAAHEETEGPTGRFANHACTVLEARRPADEFENISRYVEQALTEGVCPDDVCIATPTKAWEKPIAQALIDKGIPVRRVERDVFGGDIRNVERCAEARAITLLRLAVNRNDQLALRCWCGFGDHLANSGAMAHVVKSHSILTLERGVEWQGEVKTPDALTTQGEARIREALDAASAALRSIEGLQGANLITRIGAIVGHQGVKRLESIASSLSNAASAADILAHVQDRSLQPRAKEEGVLVGGYNHFVGCNASVMVLAGMVNGFIPSRDFFDPTITERDKRPTLLARARAHVYCCAGHAQRSLAISFFREAPLADAEALKLKIYRVRLRNGQRICEIHPSETIKAITREGEND